uniref:Uncharacterized protein n=1 Tax=Parascaris equorum TaxID=6256 RepID=A0A914RI99_PAREQ
MLSGEHLIGMSQLFLLILAVPIIRGLASDRFDIVDYCACAIRAAVIAA